MSMMDWMESWAGTPYHFYRAVYRGTPCGPSIGITIRGEFDVVTDQGPCAGEVSVEEQEHTLYCDDLTKFGTFRELRDGGNEVVAIHVSSIVEGVDQECDTITVTEDMSEEDFWNAVSAVDSQADEIWNDTHGCEECAKLLHYVNNYGEQCEGCDGATPVVPECGTCEGSGVSI